MERAASTSVPLCSMDLRMLPVARLAQVHFAGQPSTSRPCKVMHSTRAPGYYSSIRTMAAPSAVLPAPLAPKTRVDPATELLDACCAASPPATATSSSAKRNLFSGPVDPQRPAHSIAAAARPIRVEHAHPSSVPQAVAGTTAARSGTPSPTISPRPSASQAAMALAALRPPSVLLARLTNAPTILQPGGSKTDSPILQSPPRSRDPVLASKPAKVRFKQFSDEDALIDRYADTPVSMTGNKLPQPITSFNQYAELPKKKRWPEGLLDNMRRLKLHKPTPIQQYAIPAILLGRDVLACAQTGTGKTTAFMAPIVSRLLRTDRPRTKNTAYPSALVLTPTRELAVQVWEEARRLFWNTHLRASILTGGELMAKQILALRGGCDILVATPGRLLDVMTLKGRVKLSRLQYLVVDEADRLLDLGFETALQRIVQHSSTVPRGQRQTALFSATFPDSIKRLAQEYLDDPVHILVGRPGGSSELITQRILAMPPALVQKLEYLCGHVAEQPGLCLVFCSSGDRAASVHAFLTEQNVPASVMHSGLCQMERDEAMQCFKFGVTQVLVTTGVAARGVDIADIAHVINFDMPVDIEEYVHRIGRTGRAGRLGTATSYFTVHDAPLAAALKLVLEKSLQAVPDWLVAISQQSIAASASRTRMWVGGKQLKNLVRDPVDRLIIGPRGLQHRPGAKQRRAAPPAAPAKTSLPSFDQYQPSDEPLLAELRERRLSGAPCVPFTAAITPAPAAAPAAAPPISGTAGPVLPLAAAAALAAGTSNAVTGVAAAAGQAAQRSLAPSPEGQSMRPNSPALTAAKPLPSPARSGAAGGNSRPPSARQGHLQHSACTPAPANDLPAAALGGSFAPSAVRSQAQGRHLQPLPPAAPFPAAALPPASVAAHPAAPPAAPRSKAAKGRLSPVAQPRTAAEQQPRPARAAVTAVRQPSGPSPTRRIPDSPARSQSPPAATGGVRVGSSTGRSSPAAGGKPAPCLASPPRWPDRWAAIITSSAEDDRVVAEAAEAEAAAKAKAKAEAERAALALALARKTAQQSATSSSARRSRPVDEARALSSARQLDIATVRRQLVQGLGWSRGAAATGSAGGATTLHRHAHYDRHMPIEADDGWHGSLPSLGGSPRVVGPSGALGADTGGPEPSNGRSRADLGSGWGNGRVWRA